MSLHPFSKDLKEVPTAQIEKQLQELRSKYLKVRSPELQKQLNETKRELTNLMNKP